MSIIGGVLRGAGGVLQHRERKREREREREREWKEGGDTERGCGTEGKKGVFTFETCLPGTGRSSARRSRLRRTETAWRPTEKLRCYTGVGIELQGIQASVKRRQDWPPADRAENYRAGANGKGSRSRMSRELMSHARTRGLVRSITGVPWFPMPKKTQRACKGGPKLSPRADLEPTQRNLAARCANPDPELAAGPRRKGTPVDAVGMDTGPHGRRVRCHHGCCGRVMHGWVMHGHACRRRARDSAVSTVSTRAGDPTVEVEQRERDGKVCDTKATAAAAAAAAGRGAAPRQRGGVQRDLRARCSVPDRDRNAAGRRDLGAHDDDVWDESCNDESCADLRACMCVRETGVRSQAAHVMDEH